MEIDGVNLTQNLSKDQFSQLMSLLKQVKVHQDTSAGTGADISTNVAAGIAFNDLVFDLPFYKTNIWIIDAGASEFMCYDPNAFNFLTPLLMPLIVNLPNSYQVKVTHSGSVLIFSLLS